MPLVSILLLSPVAAFKGALQSLSQMTAVSAKLSVHAADLMGRVQIGLLIAVVSVLLTGLAAACTGMVLMEGIQIVPQIAVVSVLPTGL